MNQIHKFIKVFLVFEPQKLLMHCKQRKIMYLLFHTRRLEAIMLLTMKTWQIKILT